MVKYLFNYPVIDWYEKELQLMGQSLGEYVASMKLDGIEQLIYDNNMILKYKELTIGVHLEYWSYWIDFWWNNQQRLDYIFESNEEKKHYYKAQNIYEWIEYIKKNITLALNLKPQYLVWHVSEANVQEIFTYNFYYNDRQVLLATSEVFNEVAKIIPDNVLILFENLWWPGLRLNSMENIVYFFEKLKHNNVGIMLDTGHLMNTNINLTSELEASIFIKDIVNNLGSFASLIKGVHLNCSLSGQYQKKFIEQQFKFCEFDKHRLWEHIIKIDKHEIFQTKAPSFLIDYIQPQYVVHELAYDNLILLRNKIMAQSRNCKMY
ncbi:TIM barrel protein [Megamonas sp.]|uniref:TIM barrel protein n=1 Tax=Megamonas sp. TaxID=2049033 RepID=UPI00257A32AF|nr:TIM barrel protein [Megamonas sp.]MBS5781176.1 TIM barrel protein [Megamonas sp.]